MKIKRYMAESMRAALAQVRTEQGPDAVILSSRRVQEGIEVIAAVDYDEALFVGATLRRAPAASAEARTIPTLAPEPEPEPAPAVVPVRARAAPVVAPIAAVRSQDEDLRAMRQEMRQLRELLQGELAQLSGSDRRLREPLQARVLEQLTVLDIAPDVALKLATLTPPCTSLDDPSNIPFAMLARHLPVVENLRTVNAGVIALVGPTGAGKTTTIAKLAARWCMQHGRGDIAMVSTDACRIGAREQLMTYARILGAPMHVANSGKELARVLERLKSKKLVLIDTAGMGPRDERLAEQLEALQTGAARARVLLALPAQVEAHALEGLVRSFASVKPAACILTKVDEAESLGAVFSTTLRHNLRIAYLCTGQRVPEDLHCAHQCKVWLIRVAMKLRENVSRRAHDGHVARNLRGESAHA